MISEDDLVLACIDMEIDPEDTAKQLPYFKEALKRLEKKGYVANAQITDKGRRYLKRGKRRALSEFLRMRMGV